jgi:hypothetical protein
MSPLRLGIAVLTVIALAALFLWQSRREEILKACLDSGGVWDGAASACREPIRPILRRDLQRG